MTARNPLVTRYLGKLEACLATTAIPDGERANILLEIESHIAEATSLGGAAGDTSSAERRLAEILRQLGPAADLARAYDVEYAFEPPAAVGRAFGPRLRRWSTAALIALTSLIVTLALGSLWLVFVAGGFGLMVFGTVGPWLPPEWIDPTLRAGLPQLVVFLVGALSFAVGWPLARVLRLTLRPLLSVFRKKLAPELVESQPELTTKESKDESSA